jgi:peroxiredoxin family protein
MTGIEVHMFFTFWGLDVITKKKNGPLECGHRGQSVHASVVPHSHLVGRVAGHVGGGHLDDAP